MDNLEFLFTWMQTPNPMLGGIAPLRLMETGGGQRLALFIRNAIEDEEAAQITREQLEAGGGKWMIGGKEVSEEEGKAAMREQLTSKKLTPPPPDELLQSLQRAGEQAQALIDTLIPRNGPPQHKGGNGLVSVRLHEVLAFLASFALTKSDDPA
jgi:hypothetical protein